MLAAEIYRAELTPPGTGATFASAEFYLEGNRNDFVDQNDPTDQNFESIAGPCGLTSDNPFPL